MVRRPGLRPDRRALSPRPRSALAATLTSAALAACGTSRGIAPSAEPSTTHASIAMPGPGPIPRERDVARLDAECRRCHAQIADDWATSMHARSSTDPVYQRSFAREPSSFCHDCHAPEKTSAEHGIGCVTCHDPRGTGVVLAVAALAPTPAPHAIVRDARFGGDDACAGCHQFAFPDAEARGHDGALIQRTIDEHRASRFADRSCASCHMPKRAVGGRAHAFTATSDEATLRRALVVRAVTRDAGRIVLDLEPGEVGHAFPTGDLFRRLLVVAEVVADDYRIVTRAERGLGRHFRFEPARASGATVQRELADDRIDRPRRIALDLGDDARGRAVAWRIEYQRVEAMRGDDATVADRIVIARGMLATNGGER
ncbi:MAG: hypothetical protein JST00_21155 [Deltaproteobacteria bacterium]|nr:hypothetical protein [Deltaproteobacteria bacterium]